MVLQEYGMMVDIVGGYLIMSTDIMVLRRVIHNIGGYITTNSNDMIDKLFTYLNKKLPYRFRKYFFHCFDDENNDPHYIKGPARSFNLYEFVWYHHGVYHRYYGPAVKLYITPRIYKSWYHYGDLVKRDD